MEKEDIKKLNLYEKMLLITEEIGVVEKNLKVAINKSNSYKAVSERDVLDAVKPMERKYRVYSFPVKREVIDKDTLIKETEYNGNITRTNILFMRIDTTYRFINIDNPDEYIETTVYGDGLDTGDKAPGKAMTYADKYALMKAYKLSTGDDPDKDPSPEKGYTKKSETDYRQQLIDYCNKNGLDMNELAKDYKLNAKSKQEDFKRVLNELDWAMNATIEERLGKK